MGQIEWRYKWQNWGGFLPLVHVCAGATTPTTDVLSFALPLVLFTFTIKILQRYKLVTNEILESKFNPRQQPTAAKCPKFLKQKEHQERVF